MVDVTVIVETMKREDLEVGAWVNVVGYVQKSRGKGTGSVRVLVQAVTVWSAVAVRLGEYEKALAGRLEVERERDACTR